MLSIIIGEDFTVMTNMNHVMIYITVPVNQNTIAIMHHIVIPYLVVVVLIMMMNPHTMMTTMELIVKIIKTICALDIMIHIEVIASLFKLECNCLAILSLVYEIFNLIFYLILYFALVKRIRQLFLVLKTSHIVGVNNP